MESDNIGLLEGAVDHDQVNQEAAAASANLKMHVLLIVSTKEEQKLVEKIYDAKFSKISIASPETKKVPKDVHAIVAYCGKDDLSKIGEILD